ncbi:hypothetical protein L6452_30016 [Arctium lappa]|uniref:Uncharacterized protein n=1 Tax=Arctium lappa TaxID=4217 RepID=A0ACB8ZIP7_ARCLA|nr:hypothetical protein L6452_30016 [Arctium lappa]
MIHFEGRDTNSRVRFFNSQPLSHCSHSTIAAVKVSLLHHLPSTHAPTSTLLISNKQQMLMEDGIEKLEVPVQGRRPAFDEKDKRIQELTAELRVKKRLSAAYREQLLALMKDVDGHNEHISTKVQVVRNNLKKLEAGNVHIEHR